MYSLDFTTLDVAVGYRGKLLGHVTSEHGHVRAMGSSYVEAMLDLSGIEVLSDVVYMLEDLARGTVPFDTVTAVAGWFGLTFFKFPLKVKNAKAFFFFNCYICFHRKFYSSISIFF